MNARVVEARASVSTVAGNVAVYGSGCCVISKATIVHVRSVIITVLVKLIKLKLTLVQCHVLAIAIDTMS